MWKSRMYIGYSPDIVEEVMKAVDNRFRWDPMVNHVLSLDMSEEPTFYYSMPDDLSIHPRDFVVTQSSARNYQGGTNVVIINVTPKNYNQDPSPDHVRGHVFFNGWIIRPTENEGESLVSWVSKTDMCGVIPRSIYGKMMKSVCRTMRRRIERECRSYLEYANRA